ncbi:hypothetical protein AOLI_G00165050 [Acnodon oligacanthus]
MRQLNSRGKCVTGIYGQRSAVPSGRAEVTSCHSTSRETCFSSSGSLRELGQPYIAPVQENVPLPPVEVGLFRVP